MSIRKITALVILSAICGAGASGQLLSQQPSGDVARGPQFFYESTPGTQPVRLDVKRMPLLMRRITLHLENVTLDTALIAIMHEARLRLVYSRTVLPMEKRVSLKAEDITVAGALGELLVDLDVDVLFNQHGQAMLVPRSQTAAAVRFVGTLTGRVSDSTSREGIAGAIVTVDGLKSAATTSAKGTFTLAGVPAGAHLLRVRRLGYKSLSKSFDVKDGDTARVNLVIERIPTTLTEIVVTPTGERQRLEVGNAIGTIKADSIVQTAFIRNMSDLLQARTPGVVVSNTTGLVGAPSEVRIRGQGSVWLNNDPIVIVDGARVFARVTSSNSGNDAATGLVAVNNLRPTSTGVFRQFAPSPLDDIDPTTIESIDVLRGPSAAALYGTEAANGVIVIKTKRPTTGSLRYSVMADQGTSYLPGEMPLQWFGWGHMPNGTITRRCRIADNGFGLPNVAEGTCSLDSVTAFNAANNPDMTTIGRGTSQSVSGSLSGGSGPFSQFLSARWVNNVGMSRMSNAESRRVARVLGQAPPSWMTHPNTEGNFDLSSRSAIRFSNRADVSVSISGLHREVLSAPSATPSNVISTTSVTAAAGPWDTLLYVPAEVQRVKQSTAATRAYASASGNVIATPWLSFRATVGGDYLLRNDEALARISDCTVLVLARCRSGRISRRGETMTSTVDAAAVITLNPRPWLGARSSIGQQYSRTSFYDLQAGNSSSTDLAFGTDLISPVPVPRFANAQLYDVSEGRDESATAGWHLEQTLSLRERLFLTGAIRRDAASAFGANVNATPPIYPKASLSWLISEEPFFARQPVFSTLRVRAAYGHSGTQASQADKLNSYVLFQSAGAAANVTSIILDRLGNPDLKPERTKEWEAGVDATFLDNDRLRFELTVYRKVSDDAIMPTQVPSSFGINALRGTSTKLINVGSVENRGSELSGSARIIDLPSLSWNVFGTYSHNANKLVASPYGGSIPGLSALRVGYPLTAVFSRKLVSYSDANGDGILTSREIVFSDTAEYLGASDPGAVMTYGSSIALLRGTVTIDANLSHLTGLMNGIDQLNTNGLVGQRCAYDRTCTIAEQAALAQRAWGANSGASGRTDVLRLNELSIRYVLPPALAARVLRARSASVSVAGRNLWMLSNYPDGDPNVNNLGDNVPFDDGTIIPQPRNLIMRLSLEF